MIRRFPEQVVAASWSHLTVRHRTIGDNTVENPMVSLDMSDPLKYSKSQCSRYCERVQDAASILEMLR
jgi:proteasome accessory factor A